MKNILHYLGDDDCITLLKKIKHVMDPEGRLIIVETVIRADNRPAFGKLFDLLMMTGTEGGKERTKIEFEILLKESGLRLQKVYSTVAPFSILEVVKA
jgi:hypothetical protein